MRLPFSCMECTFGEDKLPVPPYPTYVELKDDGRYEFTCPQGHKTVTILQQQKFELLFEIGAYALIDGYYRESVASFTASLERFYEFFVRVVFLREQLENGDFEEAWKMMSSQSERQLGAYIASYLIAFKLPPTPLSNSKVKFRNSVIHKGVIPSKQEAIQFGQAIMDIINPVLSRLIDKYSEEIQQATFNHLINSRKRDEQQPTVTMSMPTIISLTRSNEEKLKPLEDYLENLQWWRDRWHNN
ncbi:hypothetical protein [Rheinheimera pacifica]|uniref:hypothetical protein n=1 Tax=Rheinheimera pacifica TaxID=173990 RepID=UPI002EDAE788